MSALSLRSERPPAAVPEVPHASPHDPPGDGANGERSFAHVLAGIGRESARGEEQVSRALQASAKGRDLSSTELLTLQAGVYRYGEVVDLASRLVDRATTAVKTVIQGQ